MLEQAQGTDIRAAVWRLGIIQVLSGNGSHDPQGSLDRIVEQETGPLTWSGYCPRGWFAGPPASWFTLATYMARDAERAYIFVEGIRDRFQGQLIWEGYLGGTFGGPANGENTYLADAAVRIADVLNFNGQPRFTEIIYSGYSAGGAILPYLHREYVRRRWDVPARAITFGAPKIAAAPVYGNIRFRDGRCARWMNSDDPVPLVPPVASDWQRFWAGISAWQASRIAAFGHQDGGINIAQDGTLTPAAYPTQAVLNPVQSVGAWLQQEDNGQVTSHALAAYLFRLRAIMPAIPPSTPIRTAPAAVVQPLPMPQARREEQQVVATIINRAVEQNAQPVRIPEAQLFGVRRSGRIYYVTFGGRDVCIAPYRRRAHGLANAGNDFIRRLQNEAVVSAEELADQFVQYLQAASDPSSGFSPQLHTTIS